MKLRTENSYFLILKVLKAMSDFCFFNRWLPNAFSKVCIRLERVHVIGQEKQPLISPIRICIAC